MWHDNAKRCLGSTGGPQAETNSRRCRHRTGRRAPAARRALDEQIRAFSGSSPGPVLHALGSRYGRLLTCQLLLALPHDAGLRGRASQQSASWTLVYVHYFVDLVRRALHDSKGAWSDLQCCKTSSMLLSVSIRDHHRVVDTCCRCERVTGLPGSVRCRFSPDSMSQVCRRPLSEAC